MRILIPLAILTFIFSGPSYSQVASGSEKERNGKITTTDFEGHWQGGEKCQNISAPRSGITITAQGNGEVMISGLYSTVGPVIGTVKDNLVTIPKQVVPDPMFKNLKIQGNLTLSKSRKSLEAVYMIFNNDARDDCSANYHRD
jgi:hypothetical protein